MQKHNINPLNTRAFKREANHFIITVGSIDTNKSQKDINFEGNKFDLEYGEFEGYLKDAFTFIRMAAMHALNPN